MTLRSVPWRQVLTAAGRKARRDHVTLMAAGVAFYALLAVVPALIALISIVGLVADPSTIEQQVLTALRAAPIEVREMLAAQMRAITEAGRGAKLATVVVGTAVALWSASSGMSNLIDAVNVASDEQETRSWVRRKVMSFAFTIGSILYLVVFLGVVTVLPQLLDRNGVRTDGRWIVQVIGWVLLGIGLGLALAVLYRFAPNRREPRWRWVSPGALVALVMWFVGSVAFSTYTAHFGRYNETYGSLGAVVITMLWLYITSLSLVFGAEVNHVAERSALRSRAVRARVRR